MFIRNLYGKKITSKNEKKKRKKKDIHVKRVKRLICIQCSCFTPGSILYMSLQKFKIKKKKTKPNETKYIFPSRNSSFNFRRYTQTYIYFYIYFFFFKQEENRK